jgi:DNA invertase Pin-like site-specific DNA recombinase
MTVAMYMKDVTDDQADTFRAWIVMHGFKDIREYRDTTIAGRRSRDKELGRLIDDIREDEFECVFVRSLDQLGSGPYPFLLLSLHFSTYGARLISQSESWVDMSDQDFAMVFHAFCQHEEEQQELRWRSNSGGRLRKKRRDSGSRRRNTKTTTPTGKRKTKEHRRRHRTILPVLGWLPRVVHGILRLVGKRSRKLKHG